MPTPPPPAPADPKQQQQQQQALLHAPVEHLLEFLTLEESVRVLATCRSLWRDKRLAAHAARIAPRFTQHLHCGCASDWAAIAPETRFFRNHREGWQFCPLGAGHLAWAASGEAGDGMDAENEWDAHLLSAVGFVQARLVPRCYSSVSLMCAVDDLVEGRRYSDTRFVCRPLLVRLKTLPVAVPASEWTRQDVARALESAHPGLGTAVLVDEASTRSDDLLGHHWNGIRVDQSGGGDGGREARCALCDWREEMLLEYAKLRPEMLSFGADDRHRRQAAEDAILRFMLREGGVALPMHLRERGGLDWELRKMLYCALSWYDRRQCETFYRPLRRLLQRGGLRFVTLSDAAWVPQGRGHTAQLLAGVSASGHLVGVYRMAVSP